MSFFLIVIFFMVAFFMICAILLQEGKGGGLAASSGSATDSVMGTRNPLRRLTAYCFVIFLIVVVAINYYLSNNANHLSVGEGLITPTPTVESILPDDLNNVLPNDLNKNPLPTPATPTLPTTLPSNIEPSSFAPAETTEQPAITNDLDEETNTTPATENNAPTAPAIPTPAK